jgi:LemA protein
MKVALIVIGVLLLVALLVFGQLMGTRNSLVAERAAIDSQWAQVDVALQRRADLIPNLVETVKGFAKQEQAVIKEVTDARAALISGRTPQEKMQANSQLDGALGRLLVVVENYPQLKSNENFLRLQDELAGTENRIAVERRKYNEAVQRYNTDIELFPKNIAASLFSFTARDYFKADAAARTVPKVSFENK